MSVKNLLSKTNHILVFTRTGLDPVELLLQDVAIPALGITGASLAAPKVSQHSIPGTGIVYSPLVISVLADENLESYIAVYKWIKEIVEPYKGNDKKLAESYAQASLHLLTNNKSTTGIILEFKNIWPQELGTIEFSTKDEDDTVPNSFNVTCRYQEYSIKQNGTFI